jgi:hypothetical protein
MLVTVVFAYYAHSHFKWASPFPAESKSGSTGDVLEYDNTVMSRAHLVVVLLGYVLTGLLLLGFSTYLFVKDELGIATVFGVLGALLAGIGGWVAAVWGVEVLGANHYRIPESGLIRAAVGTTIFALLVPCVTLIGILWECLKCLNDSRYWRPDVAE